MPAARARIALYPLVRPHAYVWLVEPFSVLQLRPQVLKLLCVALEGLAFGGQY
jgi:hypothetical protein